MFHKHLNLSLQTFPSTPAICLSKFPSSINGTIHSVIQGTDLDFIPFPYLSSFTPSVLLVAKGLLILSILSSLFTSSCSYCLFPRSKLLSPLLIFNHSLSTCLFVPLLFLTEVRSVFLTSKSDHAVPFSP